MKKELAKKFLFKVYDILDKFGVEPFLIGGTLLGAVRDKDFIEWDKDIDLGLITNYFDNIDNLYKLNNKLIKVNARIETVWHNFMFRIVGDCPYHIDIAIHKHINKEFQLKVFGNFARYIKINEESLLNYSQINFLGKMMRIPGQPSKYFESLYGSDWLIPSEKFNIPIVKTPSYGKFRITYIRPITEQQ